MAPSFQATRGADESTQAGEALRAQSRSRGASDETEASTVRRRDSALGLICDWRVKFGLATKRALSSFVPRSLQR
jgi:hypothetical protein